MFMIGGGYLAFFFLISHNFEGVQALTDTTRPSNKGCQKNSFLYKQVPLIIKSTHLALTYINLHRLLHPQTLAAGGSAN